MVLEDALGIDARAHLPPFEATPLVNQAPALVAAPNPAAYYEDNIAEDYTSRRV